MKSCVDFAVSFHFFHGYNNVYGINREAVYSRGRRRAIEWETPDVIPQLGGSVIGRFDLMRKLFSLDGPLAKVMGTAADLILINLLWLICAIPLVTIGAATAAGHCACRKLRHGEGAIVRNFFTAFRRDFKQATLAWFLVVLAAIGLFVDFSLLLPLDFPGKIPVVIVLWMVVLICLFLVQYLFPLLSQFQNTLPNMLSNSLRFALRDLKTSILLALPVVAIVLLLLLATRLFLRLGMVWLLFGFSLPAYLQSKLLEPVFAPYRPENQELSV